MTCSYQALARYDEMSFCGRARCTGDIRQRQRKDLESHRLENRHIQRLKNRHLLSYQSSFDDERLSELGDYSSSGYDVVDYADNDNCDPTSWFSSNWCNSQLPPASAPSPSLSINSEQSCTSHSSSPAPATRRNRPARTRQQILRDRRRIQETCYDPEAIRREYLDLKQLIEINRNKPCLLTIIVCSRWTSLADAITGSDHSLIHDALDLMTDLVSQRLIKFSELLHILQQGLLLAMKNSMSCSGSDQAKIVRIITGIIRMEPKAGPFIFEIMSNTGFLNLFLQHLEIGTPEDIQTITYFYATIFQVLCDCQTTPNFEPVVPEGVAAVNTRRRLVELYDPCEALKRIVQPEVLAPMHYVLKQSTYTGSETLRYATNLLANSICFVDFYTKTIRFDADWLYSIQQTFRDGQFNLILTRVIECEEVKRYPDPVRDELKQLESLYQQWTVGISNRLANL